MADAPLIVTLDGPAGSGKSTVAKQVAKALGLSYLDTGAMFRGLGWFLGDGAWDWPRDRLESALAKVGFDLAGQGAQASLTLNGQCLGTAIRSEQIGMWASRLARLPEVRQVLKQRQRELGERRSLVAEGRDMGSVVFPEACCKFYLLASPRERAYRRWRQLQELGQEEDLETLIQQIRLRDQQDETRDYAPLRPANDAILLDTDGRSAEEVVDYVVNEVQGKLGPC